MKQAREPRQRNHRTPTIGQVYGQVGVVDRNVDCTGIDARVGRSLPGLQELIPMFRYEPF